MDPVWWFVLFPPFGFRLGVCLCFGVFGLLYLALVASLCFYFGWFVLECFGCCGLLVGGALVVLYNTGCDFLWLDNLWACDVWCAIGYISSVYVFGLGACGFVLGVALLVCW